MRKTTFGEETKEMRYTKQDQNNRGDTKERIKSLLAPKPTADSASGVQSTNAPARRWETSVCASATKRPVKSVQGVLFALL